MRIITYVAYVVALVIIAILIYSIQKQVKEHHLQDDPMLYTLKNVLIPLHPEVANLKLYKGEKSYTINKDKIFLCLYDKQGEYYPMNMILYVLIHELAHKVNTKDVGHTDEFYRVFDELLQRATEMGIFNPSIPILQDYCNYD